MSKTFTPLEILNRAAEYGIVVSIGGNTLVLDVPPDLDGKKRDRAMAVIKANDASILAFLADLYQQPALCYTCLDEGKETSASHEHEGLMYCENHRPGRMKKQVQKANVSAEQQALFISEL